MSQPRPRFPKKHDSVGSATNAHTTKCQNTSLLPRHTHPHPLQHREKTKKNGTRQTPPQRQLSPGSLSLERIAAEAQVINCWEYQSHPCHQHITVSSHCTSCALRRTFCVFKDFLPSRMAACQLQSEPSDPGANNCACGARPFEEAGTCHGQDRHGGNEITDLRFMALQFRDKLVQRLGPWILGSRQPLSFVTNNTLPFTPEHCVHT